MIDKSRGCRMRAAKTILFAVVATALTCAPASGEGASKGMGAAAPRGIVASDTILSGMIASLLPPRGIPSG